ncbi:MAG: PAS domain S-box protein [Polyangia bacterium]
MSDGTAERDQVVRENEALRRRVAELEAEAKHFKTTLQSIGDAVISVDTAGNIVQMNPVARTLTGWGEAEALGQPLAQIFRIVNEETRAAVESPVERVLREGVVVGLANHTLLIAKDGKECPIADSGAPIRNEKGETIGVVLVFRDQTEERRAERELRATEEQFRTFFDNAPIGKCMTAPDGRLLRVNPALSAMLGYSVEELQTLSFGPITHPDDLAETQKAVRALLAGERDIWAMDKRFLAKDGRQVWTHVTTRLQRDDQGKPLHLLTHIQDITERKATEARLIEAQRVGRLGNWEWDVVSDVVTASEEFYRLFDVEPDRMVRFQQFVECLHPDDRERVATEVNEALRQNRVYDTDYRVRLRDGGWRDIHARGELFTDTDGKPVRLAGTCLDISERKRAQQEIESLAKFPGENPNPILRVRHDGTIIYANAGSEDLLVGWSCAVGDLLPMHLRDLLTKSVAANANATVEVTHNSRVFSLLFVPVPGTDYVNLYGRDVTERVRAEEAVRESEERNRTTLQSIGDAVISTDGSGRIAQMNPVAETLTGWLEGEAQGKPLGEVFRIVNEETRALVESPVARVLREGQVVGLANHTVLIAKDGTERPIADSGAPIRSANGETTGVVLVFRDQAEERAAQRSLQESERRFRTMADSIPQLAWIANADGFIYWYNQRWYGYTGTTPEQMEGWGWQSVNDPATLPKVLEQWKASIATGVPFDMVFPLRGADGRFRQFLTRVMPLKDSDGRVMQWFGTNTDISERVEAEEAHKRLEQKISHLNLVLQAIRNVNQIIVREKDAGALIRRSCEVLTETRGYFSAWIALCDESGQYLSAASAGLGDAFGPLENRLRSAHLGACERAVHQRGIHVIRNPAVECPDCPAAMLYQGQSAIAVRLEHEGHVHGLLVMSMDAGLVDLVEEQNLIEEVADDIAYALHGLQVEKRRGAAEEDVRKHRDQLEQRVRDRTAQLEESNRELEAFSYSVSHDLRAPLRAIDGFTRILADDYAPHLDTEGKRLCSVIHENTVKMSRLIDDLLAFSRLGRAQMNLSPIDMGTLASSVFYELTTPESRARIDFQVGTLPAAVADPTLLRQVWMNLLSNAIKFSSKRQRAVIKVSARQSPGEIAYVVQDNGAGFDMQYVDKVFGVFQRLHSSKEFEGTGVGLALVQRVIRRHGGRVWAEGEPDKGATFSFTLQEPGDAFAEG